MATVLDRVPTDRIQAQARDIQFARTVATIFTAVFFAMGWALGWSWRIVATVWAAGKVGWQEGRRRNPEPGGG